MSGYIHLETTQVPEVDSIASALQEAGRAYHSTAYWYEPVDETKPDLSYHDNIEQALQSCAETIKALRLEVSTLKALKGETNE